MISALRLCPKCGAEIPADAPEGGCPGCLLESGLVAHANEDQETSVETESQQAADSEPASLVSLVPGRRRAHAR
jgi:hypothetical protein